MAKQTMTPQQLRDKLAGKGETKSDTSWKRHMENELKALWVAHSELQIDINKLKAGND